MGAEEWDSFALHSFALNPLVGVVNSIDLIRRRSFRRGGEFEKPDPLSLLPEKTNQAEKAGE